MSHVAMLNVDGIKIVITDRQMAFSVVNSKEKDVKLVLLQYYDSYM